MRCYFHNEKDAVVLVPLWYGGAKNMAGMCRECHNKYRRKMTGDSPNNKNKSVRKILLGEEK